MGVCCIVFDIDGMLFEIFMVASPCWASDHWVASDQGQVSSLISPHYTRRLFDPV